MLQGDFTIVSVHVSNSYCLCYSVILPLPLLMFLTVTVVLQGDFTLASVNVFNSYCCVTGRFYACLC